MDAQHSTITDDYPTHHHSCTSLENEGCRREDASTDSHATAEVLISQSQSIMRCARKFHVALAITAFAVMAPAISTAFTIDHRSRTKLGGLGGSSSRAIPVKSDSRTITIPSTVTHSNPRVPSRVGVALLFSASDFEEDEIDDINDMEMPPAMEGYEYLEDNDSDLLAQEELEAMTVVQLKQQLRLRGKKVVGNKAQLVDRLLEKKSSSSMNNGFSGVDLQPGYSRYEKGFASTENVADDINDQGSDTTEAEREDTKRVAEAKARGGDIVDVTDFVEVEEMGRAFRSSDRPASNANGVEAIDVEVEDDGKGESQGTTEEGGEDDTDTTSSSSTEVWGEDARIVDDYEGRSVVVDGLSRTVIEYKGSNSTVVQAYAVGSRDSLRNFLRGGQRTTEKTKEDDDDDDKKKNKNVVYSSMEEEVYAIQKKREVEANRGLIRPDEVEGQEDRSDLGAVYNTIERDYGDWGVYTPTGAQLSSSEVQGVLLLSDVYGPFTDNIQSLADKIAFECQPVVVLVPDLFRGKPWTTDPIPDSDGVERNEQGQSYEEWRAQHPDRRVDVDIRAAAAVLRERYGVSSIAVWGTCYGGGRALEAAAGWYPGGAESYYEDVLGDRPAPPHVDPIAAIAWYPTRYDARKLFGKNNEGFRTFESGKDRSVAVMAVFAENDSLAGATPEDAMLLNQCLDEDPRIKDCMVKIFPDQKHGFAHSHLGASRDANGGDGDDGNDGKEEMDRFLGEDFGSAEPMAIGGDAEVACLLSTAWMETYTRVFLPTVGTPVKFDEDDRWSTLGMDGYSEKERKEVREDLEEAIAKFEDVDVDMKRMSQSSSPLMDGPGNETFEQIEAERERIRQEILEKYDLADEDDEEAFDRKLMKARDDGALDGLLLDAYMDDSGDAYW